MISWIVASHQPQVLAENLLATLALTAEDELVVIRDAPSITAAYAQGQAEATRPVRCYIHQDVRILDLDTLRTELIDTSRGVGIVGVVGSRSPVMPWWDGDLCGSVVDARLGLLHFGPGGECAVVDGLLLATRQHINWDVDWPGWHGYDHDACAQMRHRGLANWCLTGGEKLVLHNTSCPTSTAALTGWDVATARYHTKWAVGGPDAVAGVMTMTAVAEVVRGTTSAADANADCEDGNR